MIEKCPKCQSPKYFSSGGYRGSVICQGCGHKEPTLKKAETLSLREVECIDLVKLGYSNKRIGHELGISEQTVKNYITTIFRKTDTLDRAHLVYTLLKGGVIE